MNYVICEDCGGFFEKKESKQVKCPRCQRKVARKRQKYTTKKRKRSKTTPREEKSKCKKVKSCKYGIRIGSIHICNYLVVEGHSRGCPVEGCTKYERRKK